MLTFLHLSDLHISTQDADTQFDLDLKVREALLADLGKDGREKFDGILVTGDIVFSGKDKEFHRAKEWLELVRVNTNSLPEAIYVVPGNHEVNRAVIRPKTNLWESHQILRGKMSGEERRESLLAKLQDPTVDFLGPLEEYTAFASEFGCPTSKNELAWVQTLDRGRFLEDGTAVRVHGLNTALISDDQDAKGNMYLSDFQFRHFDVDPKYVNIVMCHHSASDLLDETSANDHFGSKAQVILSGHEHNSRCERVGNTVRLSAGAVHPNRRESPWKPCYHILKLGIRTGTKRELLVTIETREWNEQGKCFGPHLEPDGTMKVQQVIELKSWSEPQASPAVAAEPTGAIVSPASFPSAQGGAMVSTLSGDAFTAARRTLIVHFFRLGTLKRWEVATAVGLLEEGDDDRPAQERWPLVFDRAEKMNRLSVFWQRVAAEDKILAAQTNPFEGR